MGDLLWIEREDNLEEPTDADLASLGYVKAGSAIRTLTEAVQILAIRTTSVIGTHDAATVIHLCNEVLAALDQGDTE